MLKNNPLEESDKLHTAKLKQAVLWSSFFFAILGLLGLVITNPIQHANGYIMITFIGIGTLGLMITSQDIWWQ